MLLSRRPKKVAKKELVPLILTKCSENTYLYKNFMLELCEDLGHAPEEDDFTEEIAMRWCSAYCNRVADSTVDELNSAFLGFKEKYLNILMSPESYGFDLDTDGFTAGVPAAILYMICNFILTGKRVSYGTARPLSVEQTEIMNQAIIDAFESLPDEYLPSDNTANEDYVKQC